jgi:hypothetical protein
MSRKYPRRLLLSLIVTAAALPLGACAEMDGDAPEEQADAADPSLELDVGDVDPAAVAEEMAAMDTAPSCPNKRITLQGEKAELLMRGSHILDRGTGEMKALPEGGGAVANACGCDFYFHPNNGAHGGWIEGWRFCHVGGSTWKICTGGYAPVRYWNPSACGGTVHDWYPQGWHGWGQTASCCC